MIILGYFFIFLHKNLMCEYMCCGYLLEVFIEALLMSIHNTCFYEEPEKIIPELSPDIPF